MLQRKKIITKNTKKSLFAAIYIIGKNYLVCSRIIVLRATPLTSPSPGPEVIGQISCSAELSMKKKSFITSGPGLGDILFITKYK